MSRTVSRENKAEQTTAAAWEIINAEVGAREAKTARLKAMREQREAAEAEEAAAAPAPAPKKKRAVRRAK